MPRLEVDLSKLHHNARTLVDRLAGKGIGVTGVTKVALGNPAIARVLLRAGVAFIGDSRIENIQRMRKAGVAGKYILLRTPLMSQVEQVVLHADISFNTELAVIESLNQAAGRNNKVHQIVLMVELGDLREGVHPQDLVATARRILKYPHIRLSGLGANLACFGGIKPDVEKMAALSGLVHRINRSFNLRLEMVSGGNSANLDWVFSGADAGAINNLRLGESIFLGCETLERKPIEGLHQDAVTLVAEVIEANVKPSIPSGQVCQTAFGAPPVFVDRGKTRRAILGMGRQDVAISGLTSLTEGHVILGGSSDHLIVDCQQAPLRVGDEVRFGMNYEALLTAMTSPHVTKDLRYLGEVKAAGIVA